MMSRTKKQNSYDLCCCSRGPRVAPRAGDMGVKTLAAAPPPFSFSSLLEGWARMPVRAPRMAAVGHLGGACIQIYAGHLMALL